MWYINGKKYDLTRFNHPGGPFALSLAKDRDGTQLFKSYHPFTNAELVLKKYEVKEDDNQLSSSTEVDEEPVFDWSTPSEFWKDMKAAVEPVLKKSGTKATFFRWVQIAIMTAITIALFKPFINGNWIALFAFPLAIWTLAVNVLHDASHFALSQNWKVNFIASYLFPWFSSPVTWAHQHVIGHHVYTNIHRKDPDMHHGTYMWKYHKKARYYSWYRFQMYYLILIWVNTMASLTFLIDFFFFRRGSYHKVVKMMAMSERRKQLHYVGRVATFITVYIWPFFMSHFSWTQAIIWSIVPYYIIGFCFAINSQLNHVTEENQDRFSRDWYVHQVLTSHTFAPNSLFWFFFSGGLNLQIEHHLFPGVNHWHLRKIQPIVYEVCKKHNVHYNLSDSFWTAMKKHLRHIENMSNAKN